MGPANESGITAAHVAASSGEALTVSRYFAVLFFPQNDSILLNVCSLHREYGGAEDCRQQIQKAS